MNKNLRAKSCNLVDFLYSNKNNSLKYKTERLYKYIFINNHGNINMIKAIEKSSNLNVEIIFNKFDSNKNDIPKKLNSLYAIVTG